MEISNTQIPGCYKIIPNIVKDHRGEFVKIFRKDIFMEHCLETDFVEEYYSCSCRNVLRGLHFGVPPADHAKVVNCVYEEVMDVVVDLRVGSEMFGKYQAFELNAANAIGMYIPKGLAHGFYVRSDMAIVVYRTTSGYSPLCDTGVRWDSAGIPWPGTSPIMSARDIGLKPLNHFDSPFRYVCK
ncbi:MAG: dTDP-4-dehydrorhamnose 3,5-epimerase [Candidatus Omnitrophica bacterium]|nr:dTDP-4-dehydrorhamnose 3,5-epimerase [Candidatus Omnitrophota bacterium]